MVYKTEQSDEAENNKKREICYCSALPKGSGFCLPCYRRWLARSAQTRVSPTISNIAVIAGTVIGIMFGSAVTAQAQIPHINIEETCRAAARSMTEQRRRTVMRASSLSKGPESRLSRTKQLIHRLPNDGACEQAFISRAMWNGSPVSRWKGM
jgi:hypothetical protein